MVLRYRKLDADGDYLFGSGFDNFYIDQPEAVAQAVATRLKLWLGEWFVDQTIGMPWLTEVVGTGTMSLYDGAIRSHIIDTQGVRRIVNYSSILNRDARALRVTALIDTVYGRTTLTVVVGAQP
jgi:hypothetical protein